VKKGRKKEERKGGNGEGSREEGKKERERIRFVNQDEEVIFIIWISSFIICAFVSFMTKDSFDIFLFSI
jgi:hypothetical protein